MDKDYLLEKLDMETFEDIIYEESFCGLMEFEEEIPEDLFFQIMKNTDFDVIGRLINGYFDEIMAGIADDCMEFYAYISSYRRSMRGMVNYFKEDDNLNSVISELFRFREWYLDGEKVYCTDLNDSDNGKEFRTSVCEALILGRIDKLGAGSYSFDFSGAMDLEYDEYEDYIYEDEYTEGFGEITEDDPSITLIDPLNPVIDNDFKDGDYGPGGDFLQ